ncbi:MAG: hypothetical protein M1837_002542 [Sclerophora amabilis]|nr:MAG: hypothetical protein M1837_002542 [Sclerophora amabilis]
MPSLWVLSIVLLSIFAFIANGTDHYDDTSKLDEPVVNQTTCNGKTYKYRELAGYGFVGANDRDKFGDTLGGLGSSIAFDRSSWRKVADGSSYTGIVWSLPDRGWNTGGTLNFQPRVHKLEVTLTPAPAATVENPSKPNIEIKYIDTIRFTAPDGTPCTGLDADIRGSISFPNFPDLPVATYTGDGFGGAGPGGRRVPLDGEGLVLNKDGTFWVSDEYGPFVYKFDKTGRMVSAIRPNEAILPRRNGTVSFSGDSAPVYDPERTVIPEDTESGRANNQGFEGLTVTGDGNNLYVLLQSALDQEGGPADQTNRHARLVKYDIRSDTPRYAREFVVPLPQYNDPTDKPEDNPKTAAQSEIFHIQNGQFFVLARDSDAGHGQSSSLSIYRHADVFDISSATDIKSTRYDTATGSIANSDGELNDDITPATYCSFLDYNVNSQLGRFGLHNGGAQDSGLLNEKWESFGLLPVDGKDGDDDEWFLFSFSDNDFITQDGYMNGGKYPYKDASGFDLDNQVLAFKITLPLHSRPFNRDGSN